MAHTKVEKNHTENNGTANTFSYSGSFDVFKGTEVAVTLDGTSLTYTASSLNNSASPREYTVDTTAKIIVIGGDALANVGGVARKIVIRPVTDMGSPTPRANYTPGASISSEDLNNNQLQLLRKAMEYDEQKLSSTGGTMTGDLTMGQAKSIVFEGATDDAYETTLTVTDPTADRTITLPNVTGTVVTTGDTGTVTATMLAANSVDSSELVDGSIDSSHISSNAVTTAKITADAVTGAKIADDAINSEHYTDGSIDTAHIADSQVTTAKLADNAVTTAKITDGNVTTAKIAADAITAAKIADDVVNSEHYAAASIDTEHIADSQITTAKIAADAVTNAKIADDSIDSEHYVDGSIDTAHIGDNQVTTAKIADSNVTTAKIADANVTTAKIADSNVTTAKIAADAITGAKIADDTVDSEHLAADSIDAEHYASASVDSTALASNAVTTAKITDANVTTAKLAADSVTIAKIGCEQTTISDSDSHIPTSGAVVDYVAAQIAPIGGLEVIADDESFPNTIPAAGVVISITDAAGLSVNSSGVSTNGDALDNSTITINNFPSELRGGVGSNADPYVFQSGAGLMVQSTGSSHTYNYHQALIRESDFVRLSDDIDDFNQRYRVTQDASGVRTGVCGADGTGSGSYPCDGDMAWFKGSNKMYVFDAPAASTSNSDLDAAWKEVSSVGDYKILTIKDHDQAVGGSGPTFNGSNEEFDLFDGSADASITNAQQLIVVLNGVIQKPNSGSFSGSEEGYYLNDTHGIKFCDPPASGSTLFVTLIGAATTVNVPADGSVVAAKIGSGAVTTAKIADSNVTLAKMAANSVDSDQYVDGSIDTAHIADSQVTTAKIAGDAITGAKIADDAINSEHYTDGSIDTAHIADDQVTLAKMAGLARGKIIYGDSSGNPTALTIGSSGTVLKSDGTDVSWGDAAAGATGGGTNKIFWENDQTIDYNYTITNNKNAMTAGPVTIAATGNGNGSAVVVTVGDGETWTIV